MGERIGKKFADALLLEPRAPVLAPGGLGAGTKKGHGLNWPCPKSSLELDYLLK